MRSDALREILYGIAVGDAIGRPFEFKPNVTASDYKASVNAKSLVVTDDTQMSLFLAEALLGIVDSQNWGVIENRLNEAYLKWYETQGPYVPKDVWPHDLRRFGEMYDVQAPGCTCMGSLQSIAKRRPVVNDSKGNGTVMRCLPIGVFAHLYQKPYAWITQMAEMDAEITHKHPMAALASQIAAKLTYEMLEGKRIKTAWAKVGKNLEHSRSSLSQPLFGAMQSVRDYQKFMQARMTMKGKVADEALVLAFGAVYHAESYEEAVQLATIIGGDSDTVGAIAGGLAAAKGLEPPEKLVVKLNVLRPIGYVVKKVRDHASQDRSVPSN